MGRHCRALTLTFRVAAIEGEEDHDATWFLGHTERIDFGPLYEEDGELWCSATVHIPCRYLVMDPDGRTGRCKAHGYTGKIPTPRRKKDPRRLEGDEFALVEQGQMVTRTLTPPPAPSPSSGSNPCATARCRTADGKIGAACCRDLRADILCTPRQKLLESLIRSRKPPYLCKPERDPEWPDLLSVEIISACAYLLADGRSCGLHGRYRPDGRPAKPLLCTRWPTSRKGLHPGCAFRNPRVPL